MIARMLVTRAGWRPTAAVVAIAGCSLGCDRAVTSAPSAATTATSPAPAPTPTFTLSGVVARRSRSGQIPVDYVQVKTANALREVMTDAHGHSSISGLTFYGFPEVYANPLDLLLRKDGYADPPGTPPSTVKDHLVRRVNVAGDTRFDIQIVRR